MRVDRRTMIALTAAAATLAACERDRRAQGAKKRIAVIGGGIVGASIAYHLAASGADVTVLERGEIAQRASRGTFAWINASWAKQPRHYHALSQFGVAGWAALQRDLSLSVRWGGSLEWFETAARQTRLAEQIAEQVEWGEPARMLSAAEYQALEPQVRFGDVDRVAFSPNDGAVDPVAASQTLIAHARAQGAAIKTSCGARSTVRRKDGTVLIRTDCGDLIADKIVIATGADETAPERLAGTAIPQRTTAGVIVVTEPAPRLINRIIVAPGVHIHQRDDGRIILGEQDGPPATAAHEQRLSGRPTAFPSREFARMHAQRILQSAETVVPGVADIPVEDVQIGWRPLPLDGHPVLGSPSGFENAYFAITHSGVTLAPIIGALVAQEILGETSTAMLSPYRPDRDFQRVKRY